ncbi:hypothetical protein E1264_17720 [Actinomadura sp. KC216]|uniref:tyrosine-type recombinase/integrase n=1 Tax=Actinomadura sp. KC216 TaxID=2530370 RepID=UPI00104B575C|nr:site-specific integrase [Actinomadura sp. KC216]TDB86437.1 hypothetical protein E1264_17720 [Actinomadura sp. KC216]
MAVYDRWHTRKPRKDPATGKPVKPCRHSTKATEYYPSASHGQGLRWQVRWYDVSGKQCTRNFAKKEGKDPEVHADAFWSEIDHELKTDSYVDPATGEMTFEEYARAIHSVRELDENSRTEITMQLAKHVFPVIGFFDLRTLSKKPSLIQGLLAAMKRSGLDATSIRKVVRLVSTVFVCAIEDEAIDRNPVKSKLVTLPKVTKPKIVPWTGAQVAAMRQELPEAYQVMVDCGVGLGMRQGEIFGFSPDDVEWLKAKPKVRIRRQVKRMRTEDGRWVLVFALPKNQKEREVRLPEAVKTQLSEHARLHPPVKVTLPWEKPDGKPVTVKLFFPAEPSRRHPKGAKPEPPTAWRRTRFNANVWRPALRRAGIVGEPDPAAPARARDANGMHALRHYFASVLLAGGEGIPAVCEWMGHAKPSITLNLYGHLLPDREDRMTEIIDGVFARVLTLDPSQYEVVDGEQGALEVHSQDG